MVSPKNILETHVSGCAGISSTRIPSEVVARGMSKIPSTRVGDNFSTWLGNYRGHPLTFAINGLQALSYAGQAGRRPGMGDK